MIERLGYQEFREFFDWKQGEHIALIGPTGAGKSTLGLDLLSERNYVTILGTKPKDSTLSVFAKKNKYRTIKEFPEFIEFDGSGGKRFLLWPKMKTFSDKKIQRQAIGHALQTMFVQKSWTIFADEVSYIGGDLNLKQFLVLIWKQGRSIDLSLVAGTQRPAFVPLEIYSQSTHLFFWRDNDEVNLKRIGGVGALNSREIRHEVARLPLHSFLYINSRTGEMVVSKMDID